jgi:MoaA/NifB/PqqE/SkfB family radical SAM enzyme
MLTHTDVLFGLKVASRVIQAQPWSFSFNVSDRCPINCDCYWRAQARVTEMSDDEVYRFFIDMRKRGYLHVALIGGEPYVRPQLLSRIAGVMPASWLITSGTSPLRYFERTTHIISIDGKDATTHDGIRKSKGLFQRILNNLGKARQQWGASFPAFGHSVLNARNYRQIGDILHFWRDNGLLDGVVFSMATPIEGAHDDQLRLSSTEHQWIMEELVRQKAIHGDFLSMSTSMIRHFDPRRIALQSPATCRTAQTVPSFSADGKRIEKCVLSPKSDCTSCGCVITTILDGIYHPNTETIRMVNHLMTT